VTLETHAREHWGSRIGLILAMAGNAVGLGNFLRFPVQAAQNGGGAFMIPYFVSLLLLGIPLMWLEWGIGRYGGRHGHGTTVGMFQELWANPVAKYLGVLGLFMPFTVLVYYTYIESWTLGFTVFSGTGTLGQLADGADATSAEALRTAFAGFLSRYQGVVDGRFRPGPLAFAAISFLLLTLTINIWVLSRGIRGGIERLARVGMPVLLIFAALLAGYVLFLGNGPGGSSLQGLNYVWNPDLRALWDTDYTLAVYGKSPVQIWLAAAGQIFFTLSLGMGTIHAYASYLSREDDIALSGLATASTNEAAEVILGGSIAIPAAVMFFGLAQAREIAGSGSFNLAFATMPAIFAQLPLSQLLGVMWFGLLFFAGITSSVAMGTPIVAFLQEEFGLSRRRAALGLGITAAALVAPGVVFLGEGWVDEWDFWAGTFGLVLFAAVEVVIFVWIFGTRHVRGFWRRLVAPPDAVWEEIHHGADLRVPALFKYVVKWVTTPFLLVLLGVWFVQAAVPTLRFDDVARRVAAGVLDPGEAGHIVSVRWAARLALLAILTAGLLLVRAATRRAGLRQPAPTETVNR